MNLVEKLRAIDKKEFEKIETKKLPSKRLSELLGEPTTITIQAIDGDLFTRLSSTGLTKKNEVDYNKIFSANAKVAAEGIVEPNLKEETLLKHLGVATPADAAKKIFRGEINQISSEIAELSGFNTEEETENEVKN